MIKGFCLTNCPIWLPLEYVKVIASVNTMIANSSLPYDSVPPNSDWQFLFWQYVFFFQCGWLEVGVNCKGMLKGLLPTQYTSLINGILCWMAQGAGLLSVLSQWLCHWFKLHIYQGHIINYKTFCCSSNTLLVWEKNSMQAVCKGNMHLITSWDYLVLK